jgi:hypothetical protein
VAHMINAFRDHGHSITQLDPLGIDVCPPSEMPGDLLLASYGFTESQLDEPVGLTGEDAMAHRAGYATACGSKPLTLRAPPQSYAIAPAAHRPHRSCLLRALVPQTGGLRAQAGRPHRPPAPRAAGRDLLVHDGGRERPLPSDAHALAVRPARDGRTARVRAQGAARLAARADARAHVRGDPRRALPVGEALRDRGRGGDHRRPQLDAALRVWSRRRRGRDGDAAPRPAQRPGQRDDQAGRGHPLRVPRLGSRHARRRGAAARREQQGLRAARRARQRLPDPLRAPSRAAPAGHRRHARRGRERLPHARSARHRHAGGA